jgi:hypothetical protein
MLVCCTINFDVKNNRGNNDTRLRVEQIFIMASCLQRLGTQRVLACTSIVIAPLHQTPAHAAVDMLNTPVALSLRGGLRSILGAEARGRASRSVAVRIRHS